MSISVFSLQRLRDKFREFARETGMAGQDRVDMVNETIDDLIEAGHVEAATMAEWKDAINESWADLLELIDTRSQLLTTSYELLKYGQQLLLLLVICIDPIGILFLNLQSE